MKLSVSIPNELWWVVEMSHPNTGPSAIVQMALREMARKATLTDEQKQAIIDRVIAE